MDTNIPENQETEIVLSNEEIEKIIMQAENEAWVNEHVDRDFLLGQVIHKDNPLFIKVDNEHTERNIYLIHSVYEAYQKMYEAALADSVCLIITSGHRTFMEQLCEWELRWNNPRTEIEFENDTEKRDISCNIALCPVRHVIIGVRILT